MTDRTAHTVPRRGPGRPRAAGRRSELVAAAAPLFQRHGYANVSLREVAGSMDLGAPALYRYFAGKEELLLAVIASAFEVAEDALVAPGADGRQTVEALAAASLERPDLWVLLRRDALHLPGGRRRELTERFNALVERAGRRLLGVDALDGVDRLRVRGMLACLAAPAQYPDALRAVAVPDLADVAHEVLVADRVVEVPTSATTVAFRADLSRREELLGAAARVFGRLGYQGASLADVAAECGIAAPSLYHHFAGKADLLEGVLQRAVEWIDADRSAIIRYDAGPREAMSALLTSYVDLALQHRELFTIFVNDLVHLRSGARDAVVAAHGRYLRTWSDLRAAHDAEEAGGHGLRVGAALSIVNELAMSGQVGEAPGSRAALVSMAWAALGAGEWPAPR